MRWPTARRLETRHEPRRAARPWHLGGAAAGRTVQRRGLDRRLVAACPGLPVAQFAEAYMQDVVAHPFMQDWIAEAQAEDWVIDRFEGPRQD